MCSGSEAGSYLRLIDFVYCSTLGLRVIKRERDLAGQERVDGSVLLLFFITLKPRVE